MENQIFDLGTILTITTGTLLTKIENVYKILGYMTGEEIYTHQLPRVSEECAHVILRQYPQLSSVDVSDVNTENWESFLADQIEKFGDEFEIEPVGVFEHKKIGPIEEAEQMFDGKSIIII